MIMGKFSGKTRRRTDVMKMHIKISIDKSDWFDFFQIIRTSRNNIHFCLYGFIIHYLLSDYPEFSIQIISLVFSPRYQQIVLI